MPIAQATSETTRKDLKSCPGGFVELKKMSFSEKTKHDSMQQMSVANPGRGNSVNKINVDIDVSRQLAYAFRCCVVDHNLQKVNGDKYNFQNAADLDSLDPAVGTEIGNLIDELNTLPDLTEEDENGDTFRTADSESSIGEKDSDA